ncbi:uncharacterized protein LOC117033765 isoform X5 [Rhinolophus ferrumequinum]|uniref:uncharacterized protein LOC117033765 isoform X5 n=1 Tax=Rhinolophus ferrumequinum TaxID=59479 RepID=UPI00140F6228|nr:uncharacterized protein LOC117033765 isoform X5 [Rhinolophus ferrumequinum]
MRKGAGPSEEVPTKERGVQAQGKCRVEWQCGSGDWTMRRTRLALLALVLASCSELVVALQCFTCREPSSLSSCVTITTCNANETMCQITVYSLETGVWKPRLGVTSQALLRITDSTLGMNWKPGPGIHGRDGKAQGLGMRSGPGAGRGLGNPRSVEWGQVLPCQPGP